MTTAPPSVYIYSTVMQIYLCLSPFLSLAAHSSGLAGVKTTSLNQPPILSTTMTDAVLSSSPVSSTTPSRSSVALQSQEGSTIQGAPTTTSRPFTSSKPQQNSELSSTTLAQTPGTSTITSSRDIASTPVTTSKYIRPSISSELQQKSKASSTGLAQTPLGNIDISTGSHSSVGAGVGGAVGAAIALLLLVSVLGVGLLIVWRRRKTSKLVLQPVSANGTVAHMDNPVYGGEWEGKRKHTTAPLNLVIYSLTAGIPASGNGNGIHCNKSTRQQNAIYESPSAEYESVGSPNKLTAFHNPVYSDTGPVTVSECVYISSIGLRDSVHTHGTCFHFSFFLQDEALVSTTESLYVPTIVCISLLLTCLCSNYSFLIRHSAKE